MDLQLAADSDQQENPYLNRTMGDYFIPKMRYTYIYTSPTTLRHPIRWEATIEESANLLSLAGVIFGKDWNARDKRLFNNPYAQFLKFESDFTKTWSVGDATPVWSGLTATAWKPLTVRSTTSVVPTASALSRSVTSVLVPSPTVVLLVNSGNSGST